MDGSSSSLNEVNVSSGLLIQNRGQLLFNGLGKFRLNGTAAIENYGLTELASGGDLYLDGGDFDNKSSGTLRFSGNGGNLYHLYNNSPAWCYNYGAIEKTSGTGTNTFALPVLSSGPITVATGTLQFQDYFESTTDGSLRGSGTIDLPDPTNFVNEGDCAPGMSTGQLTLAGDFTSSPSSVLELDLNGYTPLTEYDRLAITGDATLEGTMSINLGFAPQQNDTFTVVTTTGTLTTNLPATVSANYNGSYDFQVLASSHQLDLVVTAVPLPVELVSFTGKALPDRTVLLEWQTASEFNASHFVVERSADGGTSFEELGQVRARGGTVPTDYSFLDKQPFNGVNYYRLREVDFDGTESHSPVVAVPVGAAPDVAVFPNPAIRHERIRFSEGPDIRQVAIIATDGQVVRQGIPENRSFRLGDLPAGHYVVRLVAEKEVIHLPLVIF
ncbi:MAG: T9SS C-terminal target domain-containing protein [Deltaproteobacteria bacterium]|nr:MAG: T9SS C-terminal target domain-containing protein [Deltaproteobacteria bacterium]